MSDVKRWNETYGRIDEEEPKPGPVDPNPIKTMEELVEDDYGMIDGVINNGSRSAEEEKKKEDIAETEKMEAEEKKEAHSIHDKIRSFQEKQFASFAEKEERHAIAKMNAEREQS